MARLQLRTEGMTWRELDDVVVVLDLQGSTYFRTNESGAILWHMLTEPRTRGELVAKLEEEYGLDRAGAERDVGAFLEALESRGLVREA